MKLKYKGNELPIVFDYIVLKRTAQEKGLKKLSTLAELDFDDLENLESFCFYSLQRGHQKENKEFTIQRAEIEEILCDSMDQFLGLVQRSISTVPAA